MNKVRPYAVLLAVLFLSGASGLINQIAWQRAVKVYLGNSETLSATIVVLVFMLGLGLGSIVAARRAASLANPFRTLALAEILLAAINCALMFAFGEELRAQGHALLIAALDRGVPALAVYGLMSFAVLILPCFLMGLTIPIAAEAAQRQLAVERNKAVAHFFFVNTFGAVIGTLGCGLLLLPLLGQKLSLAVAAAGNLVAGLAILALLSPHASTPSRTEDASPGHGPAGRFWTRPVPLELAMAFVLGALSLSYEIYLFRIVALAYTPLPWVFCVVLCGFLLLWSLGVAASDKARVGMPAVLGLTAVSIAIVPFVVAYQRFYATEFPIWSFGLIYFAPCFGFGMLFGITISRYAIQWGRDVGVFTALNTAGSGVGILVTTFLLFETDKDLDAWLLALCLAAFVPVYLGRERPAFRAVPAFTGLACAMLALLVLIATTRAGSIVSGQRVEFHGRDGVVEIDDRGRVFIDGLWHSVLFRDDDRDAKLQDNVRRKMLIAILPLLAHDGRSNLSVLNIGMGTGATARTLLKSGRVATVDAYEIVNTLRDVIEQYPLHTLQNFELSRLNLFWEDARSGMIRRDRRYDIITQSPLYLKQSGSSLLLSREYFELLKSRLRPGGIAGIYCNAQGNREQAMLVRRTVSEVFAYQESFANGYFILASDRPLRIDRQSFEARLTDDAPIAADVDIIGLDWILAGFDRPRLDWTASPYLISDDHPLVEHPDLVRWLMHRAIGDRPDTDTASRRRRHAWAGDGEDEDSGRDDARLPVPVEPRD